MAVLLCVVYHWWNPLAMFGVISNTFDIYQFAQLFYIVAMLVIFFLGGRATRRAGYSIPASSFAGPILLFVNACLTDTVVMCITHLPGMAPGGEQPGELIASPWIGLLVSHIFGFLLCFPIALGIAALGAWRTKGTRAMRVAGIETSNHSFRVTTRGLAEPERFVRRETMRALLPILCAVAISGCASVQPYSLEPWTYSGNLHKRISDATRLRLRTGGNTCCGPVTNATTIVSVTDPAALADFGGRLEFAAHQTADACFCCGGPTLEWYRKDHLLATVSIQHWTHLRWLKGWPGDARLTDASARWLAGWCETNGVKGAREGLGQSMKWEKERKERSASNRIESDSERAADDPF